MAERLTVRHGKYINVQSKEEIMCSNYCTSCGKADCDHIRTALEKLAHYEDLEEYGKLIELPCKVGDTVYVVYSPNRLVEPYTFKPIKIESLTQLAGYIEKNAFGKTVFLSPEEAEAEAALKGAEQ